MYAAQTILGGMRKYIQPDHHFSHQQLMSDAGLDNATFDKCINSVVTYMLDDNNFLLWAYDIPSAISRLRLQSVQIMLHDC